MSGLRRPDPDEPWRYVCPDCGSVAVGLLKGGSRPQAKSYPSGGRGQQQARSDRQKRVFCRRCGERKRELIDQKRDTRIQPTGLRL
jgi:hypothetical protein